MKQQFHLFPGLKFSEVLPGGVWSLFLIVMSTNILGDERELLGNVPGHELFYGDTFYSRPEKQNRFFPQARSTIDMKI